MTTNTYTTAEYIAVINIELKKRRVTYSKMLEKKHKEWASDPDAQAKLIDFSTSLRLQYELLESALLNIYLPTDEVEPIFRELQRELRMRKHHYPRWVRWGRMDQTTADMELAMWQSLTEWWHKTYCPESPWRKPSKRTA